jgi:hypothetical protein
MLIQQALCNSCGVAILSVIVFSLYKISKNIVNKLADAAGMTLTNKKQK